MPRGLVIGSRTIEGACGGLCWSPRSIPYGMRY
jgi:hypothetical protein